MDVDERSEEVLSPYASDEEEPQHSDGDDDDGNASAAPSFHILSTPQLEQWVTANNQIDVGTAGNVVWTVSSAKHGNGVRHLMHYHDLNTFWQSDGVLPHVIRVRLRQLTPVEAIALYVNSAVDQSYSPRVIKVKAGTHEGDMTEVAKADIGAGQECGWVLMELGDRQDGAAEKDKQKTAKSAARAAATEVSSRGDSNGGGGGGGVGGLKGVQPFSYRDVAAVVGHRTVATPPSPSTANDAVPATSPPASPALFADAALTVADRWLWCTMLDICICENQFNGRDCHLRGIYLTGPRYEELEKGQLEEDGVGAEAERGAAASVKAIISGVRPADSLEEGDDNGRRAQQDWLLR